MKMLEVYSLFDIEVTKGKDVYIFDKNGQSYLDLYGGHAVISVGHSHPHYIGKISDQLNKIGFYSNSVLNPLQDELASKLGELSGLDSYNLFLCNSGAEANENALKLASFQSGRTKVIAFKNAFHGRTSAAVATTDNPKIKAPINNAEHVHFLSFGDIDELEKLLKNEDIAAVIFEVIQGIGGLDEAEAGFYKAIIEHCNNHGTLAIADEVQCGYGRSGDFFAFQKHHIEPHIISLAKGMGNGFPIGGILVHPDIKVKSGQLGSTFGGNHLACAAGIAVLDIIKKQELMKNSRRMEEVFRKGASDCNGKFKVKGRGLMLGLEFDKAVADLRKKLLFDKHIFTGSSANPNILRLLPPLTIEEHHIETFFDSINELI